MPIDTLPPGTRIPVPDELDDKTTTELMVELQGRVLDTITDHWWRDKCITFAAAFALGLLAGACLAALAWAHMGG